MRMGWANRLTVARGVLSLVLWGLLHVIGYGHEDDATLWWTAFGLFAVTAFTDVLDGWLARHFHEVSQFGRIADPLVDKLLILGSALFLLPIDHMSLYLPPSVVGVMLLRELLVTTLRAQVEASGVNFQARTWGKWKMLAQCVAVGGVMWAGAGVAWCRSPVWDLAGPPAVRGQPTLPWVLSVVAALVTAASGVEYVVRARAALRTDRRV